MTDRYERLYGNCQGPTDEQEREARRRHWKNRQRVSQAGQGSWSHIIGTPRKAKHRGGKIEGVTLK